MLNWCALWHQKNAEKILKSTDNSGQHASLYANQIFIAKQTGLSLVKKLESFNETLPFKEEINKTILSWGHVKPENFDNLSQQWLEYNLHTPLNKSDVRSSIDLKNENEKIIAQIEALRKKMENNNQLIDKMFSNIQIKK